MPCDSTFLNLSSSVTVG